MPLFVGENANDSLMISRCLGRASHACLEVPTIASKYLTGGKAAQVLMAQAPILICTPNVISKVTPMALYDVCVMFIHVSVSFQAFCQFCK